VIQLKQAIGPNSVVENTNTVRTNQVDYKTGIHKGLCDVI